MLNARAIYRLLIDDEQPASPAVPVPAAQPAPEPPPEDALDVKSELLRYADQPFNVTGLSGLPETPPAEGRMTARDWIKLIVEGTTPYGWETTRGVYANLSRWPNFVEYYVKCPKCGLVHGDFKSLKDAMSKKLCDYCNMDVINKLKLEIEQVDDPEHKPKSMAKLVGEAEEFDPFYPPELPPGHPSSEVPVPDEDVMPDIKGQISNMLVGNWVDITLRDLAHALKESLSDLTIDVRWSERHGNYDSENPDATTMLKVDTTSGSEYVVFKDFEAMESYAIEIVKTDLENEPELFTQSWLENFINKERLAQAIGDPYEDWESEEVPDDYTELLNKLCAEGYVDADDTKFFKQNGDPRIENPVRVKALDAIKDKYVEERKPIVTDPLAWLEDIYGKADAMREAIKLAGIDVEAAAKSAVESDGASHFIARCDGNVSTLENGSEYCRLN